MWTSLSKWRTDAEQYSIYLLQLSASYHGAFFTRDEINQACQKVMSHSLRPGIETMRLLLMGDRQVMRDFIRELGKLLPDS